MRVVAVNFDKRLMVLSILMSSVIPSFISIETSFAQSNDSDNNIRGQYGEGNDASQSDSNSESSNQDSMCVSGDSTVFSCNSLSREDLGNDN